MTVEHSEPSDWWTGVSFNKMAIIGMTDGALTVPSIHRHHVIIIIYILWLCSN